MCNLELLGNIGRSAGNQRALVTHAVGGLLINYAEQINRAITNADFNLCQLGIYHFQLKNIYSSLEK